VIQHENDHLNGIVFLDRVTDTRKLLGREEYIGLPKKRS
jgi:peptide deformylase